LSAQNGLLIRNRTNFEEGRNLDAVIFDKTGTLTEGKFGVTDIVPSEGHTEDEVLQLGASLEQESEHPIAVGMVKSAEDKCLTLNQISDFQSITCKGNECQIDDKKVNVVSLKYVEDIDITYDTDRFEEMSESGKTVVFVLVEDELIGMIALADIIRESAKEAIATLHENNVHTI